MFSDPENRMKGSPLLKFDTLWFSDGGVFDNIGTEPLILSDRDKLDTIKRSNRRSKTQKRAYEVHTETA